MEDAGSGEGARCEPPVCTIRDMQGALYFPFITVPPTAWWTRVMLYWDNVATIVPRQYIRHPELHSAYTRELVTTGLLHQVLPDEARNLGENFGKYLHRLSSQEVDRRRRGFNMGDVARVHADKWMAYESGLREVGRLGLADLDSSWPGVGWILVEATTAAEFMAALALSLCESAGLRGWRYSDRDSAETWVPATNIPPAIRALMTGLEPVSAALEQGTSPHKDKRRDTGSRDSHTRYGEAAASS